MIDQDSPRSVGALNKAGKDFISHNSIDFFCLVPTAIRSDMRFKINLMSSTMTDLVFSHLVNDWKDMKWRYDCLNMIENICL